AHDLLYILRTELQIPSIGRIVHYKLSAQDVEQIMRRRTTRQSIANRIKTRVQRLEFGEEDALAWPIGAQAHIGNNVHEGDIFPMLIVRTGLTSEDSVNGQVFLDGCDVLWTTSVTVGDEPGHFSWPTRT